MNSHKFDDYESELENSSNENEVAKRAINIFISDLEKQRRNFPENFDKINFQKKFDEFIQFIGANDYKEALADLASKMAAERFGYTNGFSPEVNPQHMRQKDFKQQRNIKMNPREQYRNNANRFIKENEINYDENLINEFSKQIVYEIVKEIKEERIEPSDVDIKHAITRVLEDHNSLELAPFILKKVSGIFFNLYKNTEFLNKRREFGDFPI